MVSYTTCWKNGEEIWNLLHNRQKDIFHLDWDGNIPNSFEEIKNEKIKLQQQEDDVDHIFDVPVDLFEQIVGFRYDTAGEDDKWEILERTTKSKIKKWWNPFR